MKKIELLSPAKNLDFGREAINHGADAVYIGAPAFGARQAATNSIGDIDQLVRYAHLYGCRVFATVNTLLFDDELEVAVNMIRQLYNVGIDALILQDLGLLECNLPPIELHASTQCHNASIERIKFMESTGFKRVILARETSLEQMAQIHQATNIELEAFVHGALCVCYSGQCYMSQYLNGRSGNRGSCSQPCRSKYDLYTDDGHLMMKDRHLLSLRDLNASQSLAAMIDAGISSFKIEGRLKDIEYIKNVTAHYRRLLDNLIDEHERASSGRNTFLFEPDVEKTFNRGYTDYFLHGRHKMASFDTQKSIGKRVGEVTAVGSRTISVSGNEPFFNGDGLCFTDSDGRVHGFLVNDVNGRVLRPNTMPKIEVGTTLWRNNDIQMERILKGNTAIRKIGVSMLFYATPHGFTLEMTDEDGIKAAQHIEVDHTAAENASKSTSLITKQLSKLGNTPYSISEIIDATQGQYFIPSLMLNQLRRDAVEQLSNNRIEHFKPADSHLQPNDVPYPAERLDYRANVVNNKSEAFYKRHGIKEIERGVEQTGDYDGKALMTTKYCLRYELGCCLKGKSAGKPMLDIKPSDTLILRNNERRFRLEFDCGNCLMKIFKC